ncbi:hypothetical protein PFUGPA_01370 [Plasmodium falciparum Palo Alto/Uganda]|uniref:Uncharacterized protein n=4 Tax=Plasmodium falciparum TaxID=5833 RepID=W4J2Y3_PLAFP|nr:hypothetical protein PFUGPA_01370 [Plasmodium falciparum Palo Alto/Uganda]ETW61410.1 hypothetical protein PFMC_02830 [Plasmodium falciparum CAMP/Malaysia]
MLTEYRKNIKESFEHILTDKGSIYIYIYTNQSKNRIRCEIVRTNDDTMGKYEDGFICLVQNELKTSEKIFSRDVEEFHHVLYEEYRIIMSKIR